MGPFIDYRGTFAFGLPPDAVWQGMESTDEFEGWWSWLREFTHDGDRLVVGSVLHGVVEPPLPYRLRIDVEVTRAEPPTHIEADVRGDLVGPARIHIAPTSDGSAVDVAWRLEMKQSPMRLAARFGRPLLQWGHDRVVEMTVTGFRRRVELSWAERSPDGLSPDG